MPDAQPDPSEAEIAAECLAIQDGWTETERARRYVGGRGEWVAKLWPECPEEGELSGW